MNNNVDDIDINAESNESDEEIPTVSVTMDTTGEIKNIVSDEGITLEKVEETEQNTDNDNSDEILNDESIADSEPDNNDEILDSEITEEQNKNIDENQEMTENVDNEQVENNQQENIEGEEEQQDMQERAAVVQNVLTDYYGVSITSDNGKEGVYNKKTSEMVDGKGSVMQKYTYYSKKEHYNNKVTVKVRTEGNGINEKIKLSAGEFGFCQNYNEVIDPTNNALLVHSVDYVIINLDPEAKQVRLECSIDDPQKFDKTITRIFDIKLKGNEATEGTPTAPTTPQFVIDSEGTGLLLMGVDARMEYRKEETSTWTDCTDGYVAFEAPEENTNYYVRYKADGDIPASLATKVTAYARPAAPIFRLDSSTEKILQAGGFKFDKTYEMKIDDGNYFDVTDEMIENGVSSLLDDVPAGTSQILYIRKKATDTVPSGFETQIKLLPRAVMPNVQYNKVTFQLTGVTSGMQYYNPIKSSWLYISKDISLESLANTENEVEIKVRMAAKTDINSASRPYVFTIPKLSPSPTWEIDYKNELLKGFIPNQTYEWRAINTSVWKTFQGPSVPISELGYVSSGINIYVRRPQTTTEAHSGASYINIPRRANSPTVSFSCNDPRYKDDVVITDIDNTMEYSLDLGKTWNNVTGTEMVTDFRDVKYKIYFRYKATDTAFYSNSYIFNIGLRGAAPTSYINTVSEILNTTSSMEYSYDNVNYNPCAGQMDMKTVVDAIPKGQTKNIYIRKAATKTSPYSLTKTITMYARREKPTTPKYDSTTHVLSGITSDMIYKAVSDTTWRTTKQTSVNLTTYMKNYPNDSIEIRYKATSTASASASLILK